MKPTPLQIGDIVQINPEHDEIFAACIMVVTEPKPWGAQGYVTIPHAEGSARAYYRCKYENMELVGKAEWIRQHPKEDKEA